MKEKYYVSPKNLGKSKTIRSFCEKDKLNPTIFFISIYQKGLFLRSFCTEFFLGGGRRKFDHFSCERAGRYGFIQCTTGVLIWHLIIFSLTCKATCLCPSSYKTWYVQTIKLKEQSNSSREKNYLSRGIIKNSVGGGGAQKKPSDLRYIV